MFEIKESVTKFMKKYGMSYENINMNQSCQIFIEEMKRGLNGEKSSLRMIPTYIYANTESLGSEPIIVIDAGGTNLRTALVHFDGDGNPLIEDFEIHPMPGSQGIISRDEFFQTIAKSILPLLHKSGKIGFCFSYPTEMLPNKDGRLIKFSKEVQATGVEGELIGAGLLNTIERIEGIQPQKIILLNDTVATLLGGRAAFPDRVYDSYAGFILGTGTNTCYAEEVENIGKLSKKAAPKRSMLINIESGAYGKVGRGILDVEFDNTTVNPNEYIFEKMISGGYQGGLLLTIIKRAAEDGLFSCVFSETIRNIKNLASRDIDDFLYYPYKSGNILSDCCSGAKTDDGQADRMTLYFLADAQMERAAKLTAINLAAVMLKTGKGKNPCKPVCISAEGTTFYKSKFLRSKLDYYVKTFMNEEKGIYCEFVQTKDATLIGTAIAALTD